MLESESILLTKEAEREQEHNDQSSAVCFYFEINFNQAGRHCIEQKVRKLY